ncbi:MAG: cell division protein ZapA [Anaerococcus sp.]|nr:cell division protein ZapA [Anaerococcus sp.]
MSEYKVDVKIDGKEYRLVTDEPKENIKDIAKIFDRKIQEVKSDKLTFDRQLILAGVNITDDLFKLLGEYKKLKAKSEEPLLKYPSLKEELGELKEEKETLKEENNKLASSLEAKEEENKNLKKDLARLKHSSERIEKLKTEVKRLQVELMDLQKENETLKGNL